MTHPIIAKIRDTFNPFTPEKLELFIQEVGVLFDELQKKTVIGTEESKQEAVKELEILKVALEAELAATAEKTKMAEEELVAASLESNNYTNSEWNALTQAKSDFERTLQGT